MSVRTMPGFDTYGINEHDELVVKDRRVGWRPIHQGKAISMLRGDKCTTVSRAKFRFCVDKQIDPTTFDSRKYVVTKDGEFITRTELNLRSAKIRESKKTHATSISKIEEEIRWLNASLQFYKGNREDIIVLIENFHSCLVRITQSRAHVPESFADACSAEAEFALLSSLEKGSVTNPKRWLTQKAVCLCRDAIGRTAFRIENWGNM